MNVKKKHDHHPQTNPKQYLGQRGSTHRLPCQHYRRRRYARTSTAAGAVVGGAAGNRLGKGRGSTIGAVVGAVAGAAIEEGMTWQKGLEIMVKLDSGRLLAITQSTDENFRPGERIRALTGAGVTRVTH